MFFGVVRRAWELQGGRGTSLLRGTSYYFSISYFNVLHFNTFSFSLDMSYMIVILDFSIMRILM